MNINAVPYDEDLTRSMLELQVTERVDILYRMNLEMKYLDKWPCNEHPTRKVFQEVFGKQIKCVDYTNRNWVWTFSNDDNTACINVLCSTRGKDFEYRSDSNLKELKDIHDWIWQELLKDN